MWYSIGLPGASQAGTRTRTFTTGGGGSFGKQSGAGGACGAAGSGGSGGSSGNGNGGGGAINGGSSSAVARLPWTTVTAPQTSAIHPKRASEANDDMADLVE
jgi:hypothetical protein